MSNFFDKIKLNYRILKKLNFNIITYNNLHFIDKFKLNPKITKFDENGINMNKRNETLIISMTSYPERMHDLHYGLYSLFNQSFKPDKIILWLEHEKFPNKENDIPKEILKFKNNGLTIKWCDTMRSFCKIIPCLREYPDCFIVTADDDIYYPKTWLEDMVNTYKKHPKTVISSRPRKIKLDENNNFEPYETWNIQKNSESSYLNFPTSVGGTMFYPNALSTYATDESYFLRLCPTQDDIWVWAMAVLNKTKITSIENPLEPLTYINIERELNINDEHTLYEINKDKNDLLLNDVLKQFPQILDNIKEDLFDN